MASTFNLRTLLLLSSSLSCLPHVLAQTVAPSNGSLPVPSNAPQLQLISKQTAMQTMFDIDPLTQTVGLNASAQQLQGFNAIVGTLILTTPDNVDSLVEGNLAYISCDPSNPAYSGNINASALVKSAADMIQGNVNSPQGPQGSIVLYSTSSAFCSFDPGDFQYPLVFTSTNASASSNLESGLKSAPPSTTVTTIQFNKSSVGNSADGLGPSPTTAVAMVILYSITGIITALFLIIIITGAVRAHRHPERYGPRNVIGRPRQSRAKGIARAMLETIPIVKFGEGEDATKPPMPMPHDGDLELGTTGAEHEPREPNNAGDDDDDEENATKPKPSSDSSNDGEEGMASTTAAAAAAEPAERQGHSSEMQDAKDKQPADASHEGHDHAAHDHSAHPEASGSDNGLACSVCTDDFIKGQDIRVLPCGHKFHPECIDPWLLNVSGTCPLCRIDLRPTPSHDPSSPTAPTNPLTSNPVAAAADDMPPPLDDPTSPHPPGPSARRRGSAITQFLASHLNGRRLHDATPEERMAALRHYRHASREIHASSATELAEAAGGGGGEGRRASVVGGAEEGPERERERRGRVGSAIGRFLPRRSVYNGPPVPATPTVLEDQPLPTPSAGGGQDVVERGRVGSVEGMMGAH